MEEVEFSFEDGCEILDVLTQIEPSDNGSENLQDDSTLNSVEIPVWLSEIYFQNILQQEHRDSSLKVNYLKVQQCGGKGESYVGKMFRVGAYYTAEKSFEAMQFQSFIVKAMSDHKIAAENFGKDNYNVQSKEMEMYQRIAPEMRRVLESINEDADIIPSAAAVDHEHEVFVLEDLAEKNFVMADRMKGLDMNHLLMVLRKLARMHAASVVLHENDPTIFKNHDMGIFSRKTDVFDPMFNSMCELFVDEVATWEGYEYFTEKLLKVKPKMIENVHKSVDSDDGDFRVLAHGDVWTNNMMFKYNSDGDLIDCCLLDFQFTSYSSPAIDLLYLIFTSSIDELRNESTIEELVQYYYYELKDLLVRLGSKMENFPTLNAFQVLVLKKYFYAFPSTFTIFPVMISDDKDSNFEILMSADDDAMIFKRRFFKNPRFQAVAKLILPMLDRKGLLDDL